MKPSNLNMFIKNEEKTKMKTTSVNLTLDQYNWLKRKNLDLSKLLRSKLDEEIQKNP